MVNTRIAVALFTALLLVSCSKKEPVKSAEEQKAEMDKAAKTTRDNPIYGEQVKTMDKVKAVSEDANKAVEDKLKKAD